MTGLYPHMTDTDLMLHATALTDAAVAHVRDGIITSTRLEHAAVLLQTAHIYAGERERRADDKG